MIPADPAARTGKAGTGTARTGTTRTGTGRTRTPRTVAARTVAALAALAVAGWFAVQARDVHRLSAANALLSGSRLPTPSQAERARQLLDGAGALDPGHDVQLAQARLAYEEGRRTVALQTVEKVLSAEPKNLPAWVLLAEVDPSRRVLDRALRHIAALDPLR